MTDNPLDLRLRLSTDEASLARSQQGLNLLSDRMKQLRDNTRAAGADSTATITAVGDAAKRSTPLLDALAKSADEAAKKAKTAAGSWNDLRDSLNQTPGRGGGGGGGGAGELGLQGLRRTGGALRQLGFSGAGESVQLAGDVGELGKQFSRLGTALGETEGAAASFAPVLAGVGTALTALIPAGIVFVGGLELIKNAYKDTGKAVDEAESRLAAYNKAIASGTKDSIQQQIDSLQKQKEAADAIYKQNKEAQDNAFKAQSQYGGVLGDLGARIGVALGQSGLYGDALQKQNKAMEDAQKESNALQGQIDGLKDALGSAAVAANEATNALLKDSKDRGDKIRQEGQFAELSTESAKKLAESKKVEADAQNAELTALLASGSTKKEVVDRENELRASLQKLGDEFTELTQIIIPARENADKLKKAEDERKKKTEELAKAEESNNKAIAASFQKYQDDINNIEQKSAEERAAINKKLADTLVKEAQAAVEQSQDLLRKLQDKRADLLTTFQRGEADAQQKAAYDDLTIQITAERDQQKALQDHLTRLKEIQNSAWADEQQALLDRNFVALAKSRLNVATQMQSENSRFGTDSQDRIRKLAESKQDAERQRAQEHQQRLESYQQANEDAKKQYEREMRDAAIQRERRIIEARKAHDEELRALTEKTRQEILARANAEKAQLDIMLKGAKARVELEQQTQQAMLNAAKAFAGARISTADANPHTQTQFLSVNQGLARRAGGGPLSAGQASFVNDGGGRESFNGQMLPGGAGIFYPLKPGYVSGASGGVSLHQENHFPDVKDPEALAQMVSERTVAIMERVLGNG